MIAQLRQFVGEVEAVLAAGTTEPALLERVHAAMRALVSRDDWLPAQFARPHPQFYRQYLLHADQEGRFSVVSFVWGPGQKTPIHDHTVWGVIGMLRGSEVAQAYSPTGAAMVPNGPPETLKPGDVAMVSPRIGDIHQVANAHADKVSISIHAYGASIGEVRRHVFDAVSGAAKPFVSGYSDTQEPAA